MPKPKPNETRREFVSRCIPIVLQDGTAENQDQATAVCNAMYDQKGMIMIDEELDEIDKDLDDLKQEKKLAFGICKAADVNEDERSVVAIISTNMVDRDGEVLDPKGMEADNFQKNPVVPWSHQSNMPPIGKAIWVKRGIKRITAKVKFAATERAEEVWQLFKGGFLNAFSVGFKPKEGRRPTPEDIKKNPNLADARFLFTKWELLEFSPVTVPANADALALAVKSNKIDLSEDIIKELDIPDADEEEILLCASDIKTIKVEIPVEEVYEVENV